MHPLSAREIIEVWERGHDQHPVDRALTILETRFPEATRADLAHMSIEKLDARILELRTHTLGSRLDVSTQCPDCGTRLEFTLDAFELHHEHAEPRTEQLRAVRIEGYDVSYRFPDSKDLAAIVACGEVTAARRVLMERCIRCVSSEGVEVPLDDVPERVIRAVAKRMDAADTLMSLQLDLRCPDCGRCWNMSLDIATFFWEEISALAKRLLEEVHVLARAYGWREADILSMSSTRRQAYLAMVI